MQKAFIPNRNSLPARLRPAFRKCHCSYCQPNDSLCCSCQFHWTPSVCLEMAACCLQCLYVPGHTWVSEASCLNTSVSQVTESGPPTGCISGTFLFRREQLEPFALAQFLNIPLLKYTNTPLQERKIWWSSHREPTALQRAVQSSPVFSNTRPLSRG